MSVAVDFEEGCPCPCIGCEERLNRRVHEYGPSGCSCHLSAPCSWCTDVILYCPECGWEGDWPAFEEEWEGMAVPRQSKPTQVFLPAPAPPVVVSLPPPPPPVSVEPPSFQRYRYIPRYRDGYTAVVARAMTDWGEVIESTPWTIDDGSAEAELCQFVRSAEVRRAEAIKREQAKVEAEQRAFAVMIEAYPTNGAMVTGF